MNDGPRLSDDDVHRIAVALRHEMAALTHAAYVLSDEERAQHRADHEFLEVLRRKVAIEETQADEKRARWVKVQDFIAGSLILAMIVGTLTLVGMGARLWLMDGEAGGKHKPDTHQQDPRQH